MILVTGATGNVGRGLVRLLTTQGVRVRAGTRNPDAVLPPGVEASSSLDGVNSLFLNPRAVGKSVGYLVAQACAVGVRRIVALSAINVDDDLSAPALS
ncbi:SDR family oxidoreductase [Kibdelosporangium lantanae]|uniref:SDR family oxidoreductase n=1 Tax=Kibdelosporangium lantanae TaxID=1497396 RepID=A0ABW3MTB6_9PSEU